MRKCFIMPGRLESGETSAEAMRRECREAPGAEALVQALRSVREYGQENPHCVALYVRCRFAPGRDVGCGVLRAPLTLATVAG
jgi:ADP-ribose pyrophosphatase YjhB (NUDIX family)